MTRSRTALTVLVALASLPACGTFGFGRGASIDLAVDRSVYAPGDSLTLTLTNRTSDEIGYNLCPAALETRDGVSWETGPGLTEVCTMELRVLAPAASATHRHMLPTNLAAGEYRVLVNVETPLGNGTEGVVSASFGVEG